MTSEAPHPWCSAPPALKLALFWLLLLLALLASGEPAIAEICCPTLKETKLTSSDGEWLDVFASDVAVATDLILVGASRDQDNGPESGSAYIYRWDGTGWSETKLIASDGAAEHSYGSHLACTSDVLAVAAPFDDDNGINSGSVYVHRWDGTDWDETKLTASDGGAGDIYGVDVAAANGLIVVGSYRDDDNGLDSGAVYVYRWDGSSWNERKLVASDGAAEDLFGISVAATPDLIVVGAWTDDDNGLDSGSAYVYRWNGATWSETKLLASDGQPDDRFGMRVAADGELIAVSAVGDDDNGDKSGSVYLYRWNGSSWDESKLTPSDPGVDEQYGSSVAVSGNTLAVGVYRDDENGEDSGSVYLHCWDGSSWSEAKIMPSDPGILDYFGFDIALSEDYLVASAPWDFLNGVQIGSAYVYSCVEGTPGEPDALLVDSYDAGTGEMVLTYRPACGATDHSLVSGPLSAVGSYGYSSRECSIGSSGSYRGYRPGSGSWFFLVTATDDSGREGSYGRGAGGERPPMSSAPSCPVSQDLSNPCN